MLTSIFCGGRGAAGAAKPLCEGADNAAQVKLEFLLCELRQRCLGLDAACTELLNGTLNKKLAQGQVRPELKLIALGTLVELDGLSQRIARIANGILRPIAHGPKPELRIQMGETEHIDVHSEHLDNDKKVSGVGHTVGSATGQTSRIVQPYRSEPGVTPLDVTVACRMFLRRAKSRLVSARHTASTAGRQDSSASSLYRQRSRLESIERTCQLSGQSDEQNTGFATCDSPRACGMSSFAMCRAGSDSDVQSRKATLDAVNEVLQAGDCMLLNGLVPYQVQCLYDRTELHSYAPGQLLPSGVVLVLCRGAVSVRSESGQETMRAEPHEVLGHAGALPEDPPEVSVAATAVEALSLNRGLLDDMFKDKLPEALLRARLAAALKRLPGFAALSTDRRQEAADKSFEVSVFERAEFGNICFAVCLSGEVDAEASALEGGAVPALWRLSRHAGPPGQLCSLGSEQLQLGEAWSVVLAPTSGRASPLAPGCRERAGAPAGRLAVWRFGALDSILGISSSASRGRTTSPNQVPLDTIQCSRSMESDGNEGGGALKCKDGGALKRVMVLRTLSQNHLGQLTELLEERHVTVGQVVCKQGELGDDCFIVRQGLLEIRTDGRLIRTIGPGDYIGERALITNQPRSATVTALEDSDLWRMDRKSFEQVVSGPTLEYLKQRVGWQNTKIELKELKCLRKLGEGNFGVVKLVESTVTGMQYALKCVLISTALSMKQQQHLVNERNILAELDHPFIIKYIRSFRDERCVYFLMELVTGGDLLEFIDDLGRVLTWGEAHFYIGCLVLGLEFLHARHIAYLDLKSDNCVVDHQGYIKLIDFGMAERLNQGRLHGVKGTPLFMAPEVIRSTAGYTCTADLWSLGVTVYELVVGGFPFADEASTQHEIFQAVLKAPLRFPREANLELVVKQFIKGLLTRDPEARLGGGSNGFVDLRNHGFFEGHGFSWDDLLARQMVPPLVPDHAFDGEECLDDDLGVDHGDPDGTSFVDSDPAWQEAFD